jgi:hypothetical protein
MGAPETIGWIMKDEIVSKPDDGQIADNSPGGQENSRRRGSEDKAASQYIRQVLFDHHNIENYDYSQLVRIGDRVEFNAQSTDRETGQVGLLGSSFEVEDFRCAVAELRNHGSSDLRGIGACESIRLRRRPESGVVEMEITQLGGSFCFQEPLGSLELKD